MNKQLPLPEPKETKAPRWMTTLGLYLILSPFFITVAAVVYVMFFPGGADKNWDTFLWIWGATYLLLGPLIPLNGTQKK